MQEPQMRGILKVLGGELILFQRLLPSQENGSGHSAVAEA